MKNLPILCFGLAAIALGAVGCRDNLGPEDIRNVVLISIDTCRADHLGCYGHPSASTPNVDAVAHDGVTFLSARTTNPITLPAHCSMMTGRIPPEHGVHDNPTNRLAASNVTLAEIMQDNDYSTAAFIGAFPLDSIMGLDQGFDVYDDQYTIGGAGHPSRRNAVEVSTSAIDWLQENHEEPFFLFVHFFDPHAAYEPPEPFASEHPEDPYLGEIAYTDQEIGRVIDELKRLDLYASSLIIITADHGESLGEHGEMSHAYFVYDSTMRVPLIIKAPGCAGGRRVTEAASVIDIVPTVLAALGLEAREPLSGVDLADHVWGSGAESGERLLYGESVVPTVFGCNPLRGVVQGNWHYIWSKRPELYELSNDPDEQHNLIDSEAERARELHEALISMLSSQTRSEESAQQPVDPETLERLASLGYVGPAAMPAGIDIDPSAIDPKDYIDVYVQLTDAKSLHSEGRLEEADAICQNVLEQHPDSLWATNVAGLVAYDQRRLDDARKYFSKVLTIIEDLQESAKGGSAPHEFGLAEAHDSLGRVLRLAGDKKGALEHLERAVELQPDLAVFHNNLGGVLMSLGRSEAALSHLEQATRLQPSYAGAHKNLGAALLERGDWARARVHFETAVRLAPDDAAAHYGMGHCLAYLNDFEGAAERFTRVLELDPGHAKARNDLNDVNAILDRVGRR